VTGVPVVCRGLRVARAPTYAALGREGRWGMDNLQVETRTWRVGGELTWGDWSWSPDAMVRWVETNLLLVLVVLTALIVGFAIWRFLRGTPRY
jgi:hypothetical protein